MRKYIGSGFLIWMLLFFSPSRITVKAVFRIIHLNDTQLSQEIINQAKIKGIIILEPLASPDYLAWINTDGLLQSKHNNGPVYFSDKVFSALIPQDQEEWPAILTGRYCFWILENSSSLDSQILLNNLNAIVIHKAKIRMSDQVEYSIYGTILNKIPLAKLLNIDNIRCIYPESGIPVTEDEISVLQVVSGIDEPANYTHLYERLKALGINGERSRIGIIDTGCDINQNEGNHPDLSEQISQFIQYPGSPGFDYIGHGTHMAGIIAGNGKGLKFDAYESNLGLGFAPAAKLSISNALIASPFPPASGYQGMIADIAGTGVHLCNNSWNDGEGTAVGYHPNCAIWDASVRNADPTGSYAYPWPMTVVFSAGNQGPLPMTMTSPKEAKNIITVGASGNILTGNQYQPLDISSRGPCRDGRFAPLIAAPGDSVYSCWPRNEYLALSGSSVAAAHITGSICLLREWWMDRTRIRPSPALMKAVLSLSARIVTEHIPDSALGWGCVEIPNYQPLYPSASSIDQTLIFDTTGSDWHSFIVPENHNKPVDIVLAWTDAPGAPGANPALVNNLDLELIVSGTTYFGNNFSGQFSSPGYTSDTINNVERIRVQNLAEPAELIIRATQIRGDGIPGNASPVDQDFAIAVNNGYLLTDSPGIHLSRSIVASTDSIDFLVTNMKAIDRDSTQVSIFSLAEPEGITISCNSLRPHSGIFTGHIYTGSRGRPEEITTNSFDILTFKIDPDNYLDRTYLLVDGITPSFKKVAFSRITAFSTELQIDCDDVCRLKLHYRVRNKKLWTTISSDPASDIHKLNIKDLKPDTEYEAYITISDFAQNTQDSRELFDLINWQTCSTQIVYFENMDSDPAFDHLEGKWEWGIPTGNGTPPDPESGYTGSSVLGYNLNGNYENHLGIMNAVSANIDCSAPGNYFLRYYRWLCTESGIIDQAQVHAKSLSNEWYLKWGNPYFDLADQQWVSQVLDVTSQASGNAEFQFKFTQGRTDAAFSRSGWNIDDISLEFQQYNMPTPTPVIIDLEPSITFDFNSHIFHPGDWCSLQAQITTSDSTSDMVLAVVGELEDGTFLFYPGWTEKKDWIKFDQPEKGRSSVFIADFIIPDFIPASLTICFQAFLLNSDINHIISNTPKVPVRFISEDIDHINS